MIDRKHLTNGLGKWRDALASRHRIAPRRLVTPGAAPRAGRWPSVPGQLPRAWIYRRECILSFMCRNIRPLFNFDPPASDEEIRAASLRFVRKLTGFTKPSKANQAAFDQAVMDVADVARDLIDSLTTESPARDRAEWAAKARAWSDARFGRTRAPQSSME